MSLVMATVTSTKACVACDGRAFSFGGRVRRNHVKKFIELVPGRLILAHTGDGVAIGFLQHIARDAVGRCGHDPCAVFQRVKDQITASAHELTHPAMQAVARLPFPLSSLVRKYASQIEYELGIVLVGWDGRLGRMRLCGWGNQYQAGNFVCEEYEPPAVVCIGKTIDPQEFAWLQSTLASDAYPLECLKETIRSAAARDSQVGGEIFTYELSV